MAAAIIAFFAKGKSSGPVRFLSVEGVTSLTDSPEPTVEFLCDDDGTVVVRRRGLKGLTDMTAVSLNVEMKGFDVTLREVYGPPGRQGEPIDTASFLLTIFGREHYFIRYETPLTPYESDKVVTLTLHNRPGVHTLRPLI